MLLGKKREEIETEWNLKLDMQIPCYTPILLKNIKNKYNNKWNNGRELWTKHKSEQEYRRSV